MLIALIDPNHVSHEAIHRWFETHGKAAWATCPMTENGVLRIVGHAKYPGAPGPPADVAALLTQFRTLSGHSFWPDDISLVGYEWVNPAKLLTSRQVTDTYLLALAASHGGQLATFDRRLAVDAVKNGKGSLHLIGG